MSSDGVQTTREDAANMDTGADGLSISVLIPSWKRPRSLARGLDALAAQTRPPEQLVLSVRADDEETRALIAARELPFPCVVATPAAPGLIAALNAGYDAAAGDVVVATDDDTVPHPDWLERIGRRFAENPRLGALGGPDRMVLQDHPPDGIEALTVGRVHWFGRVTGNHHLGAGEIRPVDVIKGANFAIRSAALGERRIDTTLRGVGAEHHSELDLCLGIKRDGWQLAYDPALIVDHYEEARHVSQREIGMSAAEHHDAIHNQTYALLKYLPPARAISTLAYGFLVGTRENPGLVLALERHLPGHEAGEASSLRTNFSARASAIRSWLRWLRDPARR